MSSVTTHAPAAGRLEAAPEVLAAAGFWPFEAEAGTLDFRAVASPFAWAFGYPLEAWCAPGFLARVLPPDERESVLARRARCVQRGQPIDHEFRVVTAAGGLRWVRELAGAGGADGILRGAWLDIDERRAYEGALCTERWRLRSLLEGTNVGTWEWNVQTGETRFDARWAAIVGLTPAELEPVSIATWQRLAHPEDLERSGAVLARHFAGELEHYDLECRMRHRDGHWVWVQDRGRVITRTPDGRPEWMFGTHADISERKRREAEQAALEERLREARHLESLGLLVGGLAHDFNNLLAGILGQGELALAELAPGATATAHLERAQASAQRAAELVRQMLVYSGKARREPVQLDLATLCAEVVRARPGAEQIRLELEPGVGPVLADAEQLRQCLRNLLENAVEALPARGGALTVRVRRTSFGAPAEDELEVLPGPASGPALALEVEDSGHGMDRATLTRSFEPFFTTRFVGRGLGLCVVLGTARTHGGALRCRSQPGSGTKVTLLLPEPVASGTPARPRQHAVPATLAGSTVLVIEDEEAVRGVVCRLLERHGAEVLAAASGAEGLALHAAEGERIALILLDCQMPGLDGLAVLSELARRTPSPCVVLTSGQETEELEEELERGRAAGFLAKPFGSEVLKRTLEQALACRRAGRDQLPVVTPQVGGQEARSEVASAPPEPLQGHRALSGKGLQARKQQGTSPVPSRAREI